MILTPSSERQRGEIFKQARRRNQDPLKGSHMMSPLLTKNPPPNNRYVTTPHNQRQTTTTQHNNNYTAHDTTPHQVHYPVSSAETGPLHSKWHETCTGTARQNVSCMTPTCSPNKEWTTAQALRHSGQVRAGCTERANWTSDHCHRH